MTRSLFLAILCASAPLSTLAADDAPTLRIADDRLVVELFAEHPQVVTPTGLTVAADGAVYVAESHTHFRPDDYQGPSHDRILVFRDRDGDGTAEQRNIFHQGFTHVMDIEFHPDGSLYVATRMDIHRLQDTTGDGRADQVQPVVQMETTGTYPHNGISGLAFDLAGNLQFGLGENLGHDYTLVGTDGHTVSGGGEGGSTYRVAADGSGLHRISTGWWNPWGTCIDAFGRSFGTDNDPGASPPCRLIQIVEQADYGYEYRYGRTGLHPLITWTGDIPGTLPMVSGTGEAPCAIVAYESAALPAEYRGRLLVASWADHRIEQYVVTQSADSGLVTLERSILVESTGDFRPVGLAVAPDGSIYVSDWVSSSYELHGMGRIWRIRPRTNADAGGGPKSFAEPYLSADRRQREAAARELLASEAGLATLKTVATGDGLPIVAGGPTRELNARIQSTALQALASIRQTDFDFAAVARSKAPLVVRQLALREHLRRGGDPAPWLESGAPVPLRVEALLVAGAKHREAILQALQEREPTVFHAALVALGEQPAQARAWLTQPPSRVQLGALLALKRHPVERARFAQDSLPKLLDAEDPQVQFAAVKWVADDRLVAHEDKLRSLLHAADLDYRVFLGVTAALDRLADRPPLDRPPTKLLVEQLARKSSSIALKRLALRLVDPNDDAVDPELLLNYVEHDDASLRWEAVQTFAERDHASSEQLADIARQAEQPVEVRAAAVAGLAKQEQPPVALLLDLAVEAPPLLRDEALRALVGVELTDVQQTQLKQLAKKVDSARAGVERVLTGKVSGLPAAENVDAWVTLVHSSSAGDPVAGRQIFFGAKVGTCGRCHQVEGRGAAVGPDLSTMSRRMTALGDAGQRWLLETILQPSRQMAPQYTPWLIETTDGRQLVGLPRRKGGNAEAYLGIDGKEFTVRKPQIARHAEMDKSLMPDGLLAGMTPGEVRDLLAFITRTVEGNDE